MIYKKAGDWTRADIIARDLLKRGKDRLAAWLASLDLAVCHRQGLAQAKGEGVQAAEAPASHEQQAAATEKVKEVLSRALQALPLKHRAELRMRYGLMEYRAGEVEAARAQFELLLADNRKRGDLWNVYIDAEIKHTRDANHVRGLFERILSFKHNLNQMQSIFKRYLAFEEKLGDSTTQQQVSEKAHKYVSDYLANRTTAYQEA